MTSTQLIKQELLEAQFDLLKTNIVGIVAIALRTNDEQVKSTLCDIEKEMTLVLLSASIQKAKNKYIEISNDEMDAEITKTKEILFKSSISLRTLSTAHEDNKELADKLHKVSALQHEAYLSCANTLREIKESEGTK